MIDYKVEERLEENDWLRDMLIDAIQFGRCEAESKGTQEQLLKKYIEDRRVIYASAFVKNWLFNKHHENTPKMMSLEKVNELLKGISTGIIINDIN